MKTFLKKIIVGLFAILPISFFSVFARQDILGDIKKLQTNVTRQMVEVSKKYPASKQEIYPAIDLISRICDMSKKVLKESLSRVDEVSREKKELKKRVVDLENNFEKIKKELDLYKETNERQKEALDKVSFENNKLKSHADSVKDQRRAYNERLRALESIERLKETDSEGTKEHFEEARRKEE